jgi:hypothetical protein
MNMLRAGAVAAGVIEHDDESDADFFTGRNPA